VGGTNGQTARDSRSREGSVKFRIGGAGVELYKQKVPVELLMPGIVPSSSVKIVDTGN
jgi:hypothetical protein